MRFMMIVKASEDSEAGKMPSQELLETMGKYNEELKKAGVLLDLAGLQSSAKGARVQFSADDRRRVIDGPFAETKELIGGYWVIRANSLQEAIEWATKAPNPHPGQDAVIEIRPFFELEDLMAAVGTDPARRAS